MYEAVQNVEYRDPPGVPIEVTILGTFESEEEAREVCRRARAAFRDEAREDYGWWLVREPGSTLARWIADSRSKSEYVLDLTTGRLVES